jgi:hypothetical protein
MDKNVLRSVIRDLTPGETIKVHFRGGPGPEDLSVVSTKRGRGKHGSFLAALMRPDALNEQVEIGTPRNEDIISILSRGNFYGVQTEREDPPTYAPDEAQATRMKAGLNRLTGEAGRGQRVRLESSVPEYHGTFVVTNGRLEKGKYGQVHLWLTREGSEETVELWSYRHSGIITSFEVLGL